MQQHSLVYKSSIIAYYVYGSGSQVLFCLHGYGEDGTSFAFLEKYLGNSYTLYAIDFPVHGKTKWKESKAFTSADLFSIMQMIQQHDGTFSLLAYSMGGRAAMELLQTFPQKIKKVALAAPDGLHVNTWYWITTQTNFGNKAFAYTMQRPAWFFKVVDIGSRLKLLNDSIVKFVHYYLDDKEQRLLLYKRWTFMRKMKPDLNLIKKICAEKNIQLQFLFGSYDRIILSKRAGIFRHAKNISIQVIDAGHQLLREKYAAEIIALLNERL